MDSKLILVFLGALLISQASCAGLGSCNPYGTGLTAEGAPYKSVICNLDMSYNHFSLSYLVKKLLGKEGLLAPLFTENALLGILLGEKGVLCPGLGQLLKSILGTQGTLERLLAPGGGLNAVAGKNTLVTNFLCILLGSEKGALSKPVVGLLEGVVKLLDKVLLGSNGLLSKLLVPLLKPLLGTLLKGL